MSLRIGLVLMALGSYAISNTAWAQQLSADQEKRIALGVNLIKLGCGTGSSHDKAQVSGTADASLSLRKLPGVTVGGNVEYSTEEAQGLATALQKEISAESAKLSQAQLECMKPYIDKIFNVLFPDQAPQLTPTEPVKKQPDTGSLRVPLPPVGQADKEFKLDGGQTTLLTDDRLVFATIGTPIAGRGDLIGVKLDGKTKLLAVGDSVEFPFSRGICKVTVLGLIKERRGGDFLLRCS